METRRRRQILALAGALALAAQGATPARAAPPARPDVILATTTSTMDSGLLDVLLPVFEQATGYRVKPIAVGSGQALALAARGEADAVLSHAPAAERALAGAGHVEHRVLVMHNDFVLVGPPDDPAGARTAGSAASALSRIAAAKALFVSRGDDSGTHKKEQALWKAAGVSPQGPWYQEVGQGMGQTLGIASEKGGYALTDRGTYLALRRRLRLGVVRQGDPSLLNVYHAMSVSAARHPRVNARGAKALVDFMVSPEAQAVIRTFGADRFGEPLFVPDAGKPEADAGQAVLATPAR